MSQISGKRLTYDLCSFDRQDASTLRGRTYIGRVEKLSQAGILKSASLAPAFLVRNEKRRRAEDKASV